MERTLTTKVPKLVGKEITLMGWVDTVRDHGKITFVDLRDRKGIVQCVISDLKEKLNDEDVVSITGVVKERPGGSENKDIETGGIEIEVKSYEILNKTQELPIPVKGDGYDISEEARLRYRYVDLRRKRLNQNMRLRADYVTALREYFNEQDFVEIETPSLSKATMEGARDFIVPSRLNAGKFYALPQSPQQYKQLLMTAGFERYYQTARCFRDEDLRADRGFEHTQFDVEMSFVEPQDVMAMVEGAVKYAVKKVGGKLKDDNFPVFTYEEAMDKFGDDKFDLRTDKEKEDGVLAFAWVTKFPFFKRTAKGESGEKESSKSEWVFTHNPFSMPIKEHIPWLLEGKNIDKIVTTQYDLVCNGYESGGGSIRAHRADILRATYKVMGYGDKEIMESVGHMLEAFDCGTPPHGGIALGIDRHVMILTDDSAIKETQAFPMTGTGKTSVMDAPSKVASETLSELGIKVMVDQKSEVFDNLVKLLEYSGAKFKVLEHKAAKTSEESAKIRGTKLEDAVKAMVLKDKEGNTAMVCLPADQKIDFKKVEEVTGKKMKFADPKEVEVELGLKVGAVPPVSKLFGMPSYFDKAIANKNKVVFNAGRRDRSVVIQAGDLLKVADPVSYDNDFKK
jgi:aspartyl-tRNA synthetase